jgi:predicted 2-oxoglutarate/Fe(II)-dependent dioxygenase YbiX
MANGEFNHRLSDYIVVIRGIISKEMCQQVIDLYKDNEKWDWALTTRGLNLDTRKVKEIRISDPSVLQKGSQYEKMDAEIFKVMSKAKDMYIETLIEKRGIKYVPKISSDEGYQILHYSEGYYFKEHCDNSGGMSRILTCTLNISDDHDGGLFRFLRGEFDVRLNAGDAVLFPSNFMFPHEVTEITRGERHAIVTWFH